MVPAKGRKRGMHSQCEEGPVEEEAKQNTYINFQLKWMVYVILAEEVLGSAVEAREENKKKAEQPVRSRVD